MRDMRKQGPFSMPAQKHIDFFRAELEKEQKRHDEAVASGDVQRAAELALVLEHYAAAIYALGIF